MTHPRSAPCKTASREGGGIPAAMRGEAGQDGLRRAPGAIRSARSCGRFVRRESSRRGPRREWSRAVRLGGPQSGGSSRVPQAGVRAWRGLQEEGLVLPHIPPAMQLARCIPANTRAYRRISANHAGILFAFRGVPRPLCVTTGGAAIQIRRVHMDLTARPSRVRSIKSPAINFRVMRPAA